MEDASLDKIEGGCYGTNERNYEAWAINEYTQLFDRATGRPIQILTSWSCDPLNIFGDDNSTEKIDMDKINALAARVTDASLVWFEEQKRKHTLLLWVGIIGVILALGVVIPIATGIMHGNIKVPTPTISYP